MLHIVCIDAVQRQTVAGHCKTALSAVTFGRHGLWLRYYRCDIVQVRGSDAFLFCVHCVHDGCLINVCFPSKLHALVEAVGY